MFCMLKKKEIYFAYVSKHNPNSEKQVILLLIPNGKWWYYLAVKKLSALLRGTTSQNSCDFYYLNCLHSFGTKNILLELESHKRVCENKYFCNVIMPSENLINIKDLIKLCTSRMYNRKD